MNFWSEWLDFHLQKLKRLVPAYVCETSQMIEEARFISNLLSYAFLVIVYANVMHNIIGTGHDIGVI